MCVINLFVHDGVIDDVRFVEIRTAQTFDQDLVGFDDGHGFGD